MFVKCMYQTWQKTVIQVGFFPHWEVCSFLKGARGALDLGKRGTRSRGGGEAAVEMYCMREQI